jgi:hypothetical protein
VKISCDAQCERCYHDKGRRQDLNENDLIRFCTACKRVYLCDIGLARFGNEFHCPFDNTLIIKEEVDKSIIQMKGIPGEDQSFSEEMYHHLVGDKEKKKKKRFSLRSSTSTDTLSAYHHSKISELGDIQNLTRDLLLEIAKKYGSSNIKELWKLKSKKDLLNRLGLDNKSIIDSLYAILCNFELVNDAIKLSFSVYLPSIISNIETISLSDPLLPCDIIVKDNLDNEWWVFCSDEFVDLHNIEDLTKRATVIDFQKYRSIKNIFFVAKKFSYVAKGMIKKHESAFTGIEQSLPDGSVDVSRSIPLTLWESIPNSNSFQETSKI